MANYAPISGTLRKRGGGTLMVGDKVTMAGVDHGGDGEVVALNLESIVVKWPGHMGWGGNYMPREYVSPRLAVYTCNLLKLPVSGGVVEVKGLVEWDVSRKKAKGGEV
jgi:hypothetical protein